MRRFFLILNYFSLCCILDLRFTTTTSAVSLWGDVHITSVIYSSLSLSLSLSGKRALAEGKEGAGKG